MSKKFEDNPDSIKYYVKQYILENKSLFQNKSILDLPAGSGVTSKLLSDIGAKPKPCDLFPEFFHELDVQCKPCNIEAGIPEKDSSFDAIFCQEGMEHFTNQFQAMKEMNRVLKKNGLLILTTPNYSSLQSRISYLVFESENYKRFMPPNEYDTIWFSDRKKTDSPEYYFGHAFLMNIQKLRFLWKISGFELQELRANRLKTRNILLLILYPLIYFKSMALLRKYRKKVGRKSPQYESYREQFNLNLSFKVLLHSHLFVVLKKTANLKEAYKKYKNQNEELKLNT